MGNDLRSALRPSLVMLVLFTILTGLCLSGAADRHRPAVFPASG